MSKYEECATKMTDPTHLLAVLREQGFKPEYYETPKALFGYHGDERPEKAHIIIPRAQIGGASNDVGFVREGGVFKAIISQYDSTRFNSQWLGKLTQSYKEAHTMTVAKQKGYALQSRNVVNGKVQLKFSVR